MNKLLNSPLASLLILVAIVITGITILYSNERTSVMLPFTDTLNETTIASGDTLHILTYPDYFPEAIIHLFENYSNSKVEVELFESPSQLRRLVVENTHYDLIIVNDYSVRPLSENGQLSPISHNKLSNFQYIDSRFKAIDYDYGNRYSIPFMWGTVGLSFNSEYVIGLPLTWKNIFESDRIEYLSGNIGLLDDYRVTMGILLMEQGYDPNTVNEEDVLAVTEKLMELIPHILIDDIEIIESDLINEDLYIGMMWSGSAAMISSKNHNLRYSLPSEGTIFWVDNLAITSYSDNIDLAYKFIDFLIDPRNIAAITNENFHANPVTHSRRYVDRHILNGPAYANPYFSDGVIMVKNIGEFDSFYEKQWDVFMDSLSSYNSRPVR